MSVVTEFTLIDYHQLPDVSSETLSQILNTLAHWLPSDSTTHSFDEWEQAHWLGAEWLVYWQGAMAWFLERVEACHAPIPIDVQGRLRLVVADNNRRTGLMLDACTELLASLKNAGISAIPLKGAVLAPCYYPNPTQRGFGDLDLLVHKKDKPAIKKIMLALGYRFHKKTAKDDVYLRGNYVANVWASDNVHPIEVQHSALNEYAGISYDITPQLWQSSHEQPYWQGTKTLLPSKTMLMHHVCAHATEDWLLQRGKLAQLFDIQVLSEHMDSQDWQAFIAEIPTTGARFVYPALTFSQRYAQVEVPSFVLQKLRTNTPTNLIQWVENTHLGELFHNPKKDNKWREANIARLLVRSPWEKIQIGLRLAFPPRWHFRMKQFPRLIQTPAWPLAYVLINGSRVWQLVKTKTGLK